MRCSVIAGLAVLSFVGFIPLCAACAEDPEPVVWQREKAGTGAISYSPDGKRIASGGEYQDRSFLWDVATGKPIAELTDCGQLVESVSFSADGKWLVTAGLDSERSRWRIVLWNGLTGKRQTELTPNLGWRAQFGPGNSGLAVATLEGPIRFFQVPKGQRIGEFKTDASGAVDVLTISSDGKLAATARGKTVSLWNLKGGMPQGTFTTEGIVTALAFSRDSKQLFAATDNGTLAAWTPEKRQAVWSRKIHEGEVRDVAVAPGGTFVATVGRDNTLRILTPADGNELRKIDGVVGTTASVAIAPDSKSIAVGHSGGIAVWKVDETPGRTPTSAGPSKRPADAVTVKGHTYSLIREHRTWSAARRRCEKLGGHLATFKSAEQRDVVLKLIQEAKESVWLGASDEEDEGKWVWVTGEPVSEQEWSSWAIDNRNDAQHCLCYWYDGMRLDDGYGGERWMFICEWEE